MITQYQFRLETNYTNDSRPLSAYQLYAWLLEQLPSDRAEYYHDQKGHCLSQYLSRDSWVVSLFGEEAAEDFGEVLSKSDEILLNTGHVLLRDRKIHEVPDVRALLERGRAMNPRRCEMEFLSPVSFKQAGRYVIFPQEELILQSLLMRWNELAGEFSLQDADMQNEMKNGIHIVDYKLRSGRFHLKNASIPCCTGRIFLESRLPVVLQEIWGALLHLAPYTGIGMKTTLGMGGCKLHL